MISMLPRPDEMYRAVVRRDPAYQGIFFTGVKTTGIFCRPTCPARKPRRDSVEFFASPRAALLAGYRPCKRCRPMDAIERPPQWVGQLSEWIERHPSQRLRASDLRGMRIDPARAARWFKRNYGMTFQAYHRARRLSAAMMSVRAGDSLDGAGQRGGYRSLSGFRSAFARHFGAPPGESRNVAPCMMARWIDTPLGPMLAVAGDDGLALLEFVDRRMLEAQLATLRRRFGCAIVPGAHPHLEHAARELAEYFDGTCTRFTVPIALRGTPFQMAAWEQLLRIPCGETRSYAAMACAIGAPQAHRAVARANGDNRIAIIIPCHRVVRSDGTLCGYGGGAWRKQWLLDHERAARR